MSLQAASRSETMQSRRRRRPRSQSRLQSKEPPPPDREVRRDSEGQRHVGHVRDPEVSADHVALAPALVCAAFGSGACSRCRGPPLRDELAELIRGEVQREKSGGARRLHRERGLGRQGAPWTGIAEASAKKNASPGIEVVVAPSHGAQKGPRRPRSWLQTARASLS